MPTDERPSQPAQRAPLQFNTDLTPVAPSEEFLRATADFGLSFDDNDVPRLGRFLAILLEANQRLNLTGITDPAQAWMKHIFDALTLIPVLAECEAGASVADVGSGGGVPGIPLAITMPHLRFTLIESTAKKAEFLRIASSALALENVEVLSERAETLAAVGSFQRESFDAVIARAVGRMNVISELCIPLVRPGGRAIFVKGRKAEEELAEALSIIGPLGARHAGTLESPTGRIVVLEKASRTPRDYPRRPGEPRKAPLI